MAHILPAERCLPLSPVATGVADYTAIQAAMTDDSARRSAQYKINHRRVRTHVGTLHGVDSSMRWSALQPQCERLYGRGVALCHYFYATIFKIAHHANEGELQRGAPRASAKTHALHSALDQKAGRRH